MKQVVQSLVLAGSLVISTGAWAEDTGDASSSSSSGESASQSSKSNSKERRAFHLGICVGQELAAAGIDVKAMESSKTAIDDATKEALSSAVSTCREELAARKKSSSTTTSSDSSNTTTSDSTSSESQSDSSAAGS